MHDSFQHASTTAAVHRRGTSARHTLLIHRPQCKPHVAHNVLVTLQGGPKTYYFLKF